MMAVPSTKFVWLTFLAIVFPAHILLVSAKSAHVSLHALWNATSPAAEAVVYFLEVSEGAHHSE